MGVLNGLNGLRRISCGFRVSFVLGRVYSTKASCHFSFDLSSEETDDVVTCAGSALVQEVA